MSKKSFRCYFGLWWATNVNTQLLFPLPQTVWIVPINVACWNTLKGGSDTITKLIEMCQEKIEIQMETNIATACLLLYFAVVFHRLKQLTSGAKEIGNYDTFVSLS